MVQDEAAEGRDTGRLVPIIIDDSRPPLGFRQFQAIDLSGWKVRGNAAALNLVHEAIVAKAGTGELGHAPKPPSERRSYWGSGIAAAGIIAMAVASLLYWPTFGSTAANGGALRVRLGEFQTLSPTVPRPVMDTLREELLTALGTDAIIIASAEQPKAEPRPAFAVKASVRRSQDSLRFSVHLINEKTGVTVWSETLERSAEPLDLVPRQVAVGVSQVLRCGLTGAAHYGKPLADKTLSLYLSYCTERWGATLGKEGSSSGGIGLTRRLTEAEPDFAPGWSALAWHALRASTGNSLVDAKTMKAEALDAAQRALKLDPDNSQAYEVLAGLQPPFAHRMSEKFHVKSVSVRDSDCACEYLNYAFFLAQVGRYAAALDALNLAYEMVPQGASINATRAWALFGTGRPDEARRVSAQVLEIWPRNAPLHQILVNSAFWTRRYDGALKLLTDPKAPFSEQERYAMKLALHAANGAASQQDARAALIALPAKAEGSELMVIPALAALGANAEALTLTARLVEKEGPWALYMLFEPPMAEARRTPEFAQLAQRFGLIQYWRESGRSPDFCKEAAPPTLCGRL